MVGGVRLAILGADAIVWVVKAGLVDGIRLRRARRLGFVVHKFRFRRDRHDTLSLFVRHPVARRNDVHQLVGNLGMFKKLHHGLRL